MILWNEPLAPEGSRVNSRQRAFQQREPLNAEACLNADGEPRAYWA